MSDCCLPNLGCLSIPVTRTDVQGPSGQNGISPTIIVGTVTTGDPGDPVVVTNVSTNPSIAEFDFTIPQGYSGTSGAPGVDGVARIFTYTFAGNTTSTTINGWQSMGSYTLQAGNLVNVGDSLVINFEMELLLKNSTNIASIRQSPFRRISIASGATSLTKYDSSNSLAEPLMNTKSNITATMSFSYKTTVELIKVSTNNTTDNFIRKCTYDFTTPSTPTSFSNGSTSLLSINTNNPIVFSFDIYQYQLNEILVKNATIDKITGVIP